MKLIGLTLLTSLLLVVGCGKKSNDDGGSGVRNWNPLQSEEGARSDLYKVINAYRDDVGVQPLRAVNLMVNEAQYHAQNWSDGRVLNPRFGLELRCLRIAQAIGPGRDRRVDGACGEIAGLGQPTAVAALQAWLSSPGATRHLRNPLYNRIGAGVATDRMGRPYWIVIFFQQ